MAFPYGQPNYGMNNYANYQPNFQPAYQPQMQQQQSAQTFSAQQMGNVSSNGFVYVNGKEGAKAYILQPNSTMFLMDSDNPFFYVKSTNNLGQASIRKFKFEEVAFDTDSINSSSQTEFVKTDEFKTFEDKITSKIHSLEALIKKDEKTEVSD